MPVQEKTPSQQETASNDAGQIVVAKMPGTVTQILVKEGQTVKQGENICVVEVMKMETFIQSPKDGKIGKIFVQQGEQVETNKKLIEVL